MTLGELTEHVGLSRGYLPRRFTARVGLSPRTYADARRVEVVKAALRDGDTVLGTTFEGGFGSGKALYDRAEFSRVRF